MSGETDTKVPSGFTTGERYYISRQDYQWGVYDGRQNKFIEIPLDKLMALQRAKELNDAKADVCWVCGAFDFIAYDDFDVCGRCRTVRASWTVRR